MKHSVAKYAEVAIAGRSFDTTYLSGSFASGFAHSSSDIDIFAIASVIDSPSPDGYNQDVTVSGPRPAIEISHFDNTRIDLEIWSHAHVKELVARFNSGSDRRNLSHGDMDFLWRVFEGSPISGTNIFQSYQSKLTMELFIREFVRRSVYSAEVRLDDAAGLLNSGEVLMAAVSAREAFERVVDALLNRAGSPGPATKWRTKRLGQTPELERVCARYKEIQTMRNFEAQPYSWVETTILDIRRYIEDLGDIPE